MKYDLCVQRVASKEGKLIYAFSHSSPKLKLTAMGWRREIFIYYHFAT